VSAPFPQVRVNRKAADRVSSGHPWIYSSDLTDRGEAQAGDAVRVIDPRGAFLGTAHYSSTSQIALRLLSRAAEPAAGPIDKSFFLRRLTEAIRLRERVVRDSNACRLVFSEADLLPGLIADRYGPYLAIQTLSQGMERSRDLVVHCLTELLQPAGIVARNDVSTRTLEGLPRETTTLTGEIPEQALIEMNGLKLQVDLLRGQKTGAYLDQRENYVAAAHYARGRVLDCFTSAGGFALHAARRAESVEAIDSSAAALEIAESNARLNGFSNIQFRRADVFEFLRGIERRYSMVVLDPPAFAKSRRQLDDAARGYKEINMRALRLLDAGGILVACSCSHHVSEAMLLEIAAQASLDVGKTLRVLERRTQASDHPILLTVPETMYLKCLILEVVGGM
jgi:23S rRNA (cytosine1962-C5)-methyltransferase